VIPSRTLGLSGGRLMDAWDRQFTYVVIAEATQDNSFTSRAWPAALELWRHKKAEGEPIRGVAVIISHGANGSDAYLTTNKRPEELPQGEDEKANLDNDHIFVQADYSTNDDNPFDDQVLFLTEDQIVQPLANQGALITKQAQALEKLKRIENALIGHMATDTTSPLGCDEPRRKARRGLPSPDRQEGYTIIPPSFVKKEVGFVTIQGEGDIYDPWGQPIYYEVDGKIAEQNGCEAGFYNSGVKGKVFTLKSLGPDRKNDGDNIKDDIVIERYKVELIGALTAAGIEIDGTSPALASQGSKP
jgi:hypothetical protein